ncbi:4702_t:CDS:10 [Ambispora gerdemannii]|uniref:4702_t:CDS:1 n=1 Tax=Ambispora gerdemannii TaxID=144530 RepID=A0A9N9GQ24_9GLOM|nr:4702_t:CDS:10 [Ambispora gerdemannii]
MASFKDILRNISANINTSSPDLQSILDIVEVFKTSQEHHLEFEKAHNGSLELISIYSSVQDSEKLVFFFKCIRALLGVLGPDSFILDWWEAVLQPVLRSPLYYKDVVAEVKGITQDILSCNTSCVLKFRATIIELYIKEFDFVGKAAGEEDGVIGEEAHAFWCQNLESVLRGFGAVQTKDFFDLLNTYFVQCEYRLKVLTLLCEFIRRQTMYIHLILKTRLFDSLLTSLQKDTSTTLLSLSLTTLIMLMPHIYTSVIPYLPQLYVIFTRILCWDKRTSRSAVFEDDDNRTLLLGEESSSEEKRTRKPSNGIGWQRFDSTFDTAPSTPPDCRQLFTFLYGMFPCNTVKFLQNPTGWAQEMNYVHMSEEIDDDVIRSRSRPLFRRHTLHPDLILSNYKKELSDTKRWMKLEPADVVAECIGYDIESALAVSKSKIKIKIEEPKKFIEDIDFPLNELHKKEKTRRASQAISIHDILEVHQALKSGVEIVVGDDPWPEPTKMNITIPLQITSNNAATIAFLQREIMLLRNELNFELYLKQQHLQHIGRLHRDHVLDASVEAERQNLYNTCRTLKTQLASTQLAFDRQKSETASNKKKQVHWENELHTKLKALREEKREWKSSIDKLTQELVEAKVFVPPYNHTSGPEKNDFKNVMAVKVSMLHNSWKLVNENQTKRIDDSNSKVVALENQLKMEKEKLEKLTELEHRNYQLIKQLLLWQEDTLKFQKQKQQMESLVTHWHKSQILLQTCDQEINKLRAIINEKSQIIDDLNIKLRKSSGKSKDEDSAFSKQMKLWSIERNKFSRDFQKLEKEYEKARGKNEELESRIIEHTAEIELLNHQLKLNNRDKEL